MLALSIIKNTEAMAALPSSPLQLPIFAPSPRAVPIMLFAPLRAATEEDSTAATSTEQDDSFENRLSNVRLRYRSGTGKKAEMRKARKGKKNDTVFLPPVAFKEPISDGLTVEYGFSPYSERVNGRAAILGLSALFLVELATGQGVLNYHSPSIILIQVYFVAAASALYIKYEKEKKSVWPTSEK